MSNLVDIQFHNKTESDANYYVQAIDKVHSIRFINQGTHTLKINNNLIIAPGGDFEFKANEGHFIEAKFMIKFYPTPSIATTPDYLDSGKNLIIALTHKKNG